MAAPAASCDLLRLRHAEDLLTRHGSDHVRMLVLDVLLDVADQLVVRLAADRLAARAIDLLRHSSLLLDAERLRGGGEPVERLLRGYLPAGLLRAAGADTRRLAVYHRGAGERPVVRRALHLEHGVGDLQPAPGELLLQLRLVVDMARERVGDPALEGSDDCLLDG